MGCKTKSRKGIPVTKKQLKRNWLVNSNDGVIDAESVTSTKAPFYPHMKSTNKSIRDKEVWQAGFRRVEITGTFRLRESTQTEKNRSFQGKGWASW